MNENDDLTIRKLFDNYLQMYASRDDQLTTYFSEDFSGFTGGGDFLVKNREEWIAITRQDFAQVKDPLRIELKDVAIQSLTDTIAVTTGFFTIHLPVKDHILSRETARLVLIFRKEDGGWKITHSSISIPYYLVGEGEVYPLKELVDRNQQLERMVDERTVQLSSANDRLQQINTVLAKEITEHRQAQDALQLSSQMVDAIISISPDGIGITSLDGMIRHISDKLVILHGYTLEEKDQYIGTSIFNFVDPSSHSLLVENIRKVLAGQRDHHLTEYLARRKDGSRFHIDVNSTVLHDAQGNPESILYVERDISDRKRAQEALQQSNQKLVAIISASPDGIGMATLAGEMQLVSDKLGEIFGYTIEQKDELLGQSAFNFVDPSGHQTMSENIRKMIAGETDHTITEYLAVKKDHSRFYIDVNSTVVLDPGGKRAGILFIVRDITERRQAQADKEYLEAQNRQLQKAESLGRMAAAIAHHFNNQLGAVIGNLDLAMRAVSREESPQETISAAMRASNRAAGMSKQMLTYLGQSFDKHEPLDFSDACLQSLPLLQSIMSENAILKTDLPSSGPVVMANINQMQQVMTNLITNAWEALGENRGTILLSVKTVAAVNIPTTHRFPLEWQPKSSAYASMDVTDTGCGIEETDMEKLFDPFFSSKFTGRGMGLAVVLGIVRAHGGAITVESTPGKGSGFRVFLPVVRDIKEKDL
jgi:PAS domain S-box-containing protein